jgi:hypothetical protein
MYEEGGTDEITTDKGKNYILGEKTALMPLCPPQLPHE